MNGTWTAGGANLSFADLSFSDTGGSGLPVLFLHPTPLDRDYWRPLTERLTGIRAIVPDLRGHGLSGLGSSLPVGGFSRVPDAPVLTIAQLATDILALLDHLNLHNAVFTGCSIGGYILFELWRRAPERMRGLAIVCSKPQPDVEANLVKRAATIAQARAGKEAAQIFDGMAQTLVGATARARNPQIVSEVRARMTLTADALIAVQAGLATRPDSMPTVPTITVPVLAIAGGEDPACPPAEVEALRAAPGGCDWHLLADVGHFAAYEQPGTVASIMTPWLKQFA